MPYRHNINPNFQAPTRTLLGVTKKFLTYNIHASLPFLLLDLGYSFLGESCF